ncbi:hypothetical protein BASA50_002074 [Batrachochytrium salamandrivorans]|uniref:Amino acid transporter transmembrane domain-containing protein n=1 Tax=Batrachochytrium salamandrivorans TaxID=1357716 RepID=A0ABQ8FMC1_9FUNG|nr:hypothetical protein BASA50_002074 [Batrachochytrium salamandrivorans]
MPSTTFQKLLSVKTIGFLGGLCLLFNQMTGPAIPFTSSNFQNPGWAFTTATYLIFTAVSGFSMLFLVEAIKVIPGNSNFQGDVEYGTIINFYFGKNLHFAAQLILYGALQSNAIQCIVLTAQATDNLLVTLFGRTCGVSFSQGWVCVTAHSSTLPSPFENNLMGFTIGLLVVILFCLPLSFSTMDNNIAFNVVMAILSVILGSTWIYSSFATGIVMERIPFASPINSNYGQVVGTVLLNLGGTTIVPTWINLKHRDVNVQNLIWISLILSSLYYIAIGVFGGLGFNLDGSGNILHSLLIYGKPQIIATISIGVFAYVMLLPSIPVSFIVSRDNLVQNEIAPQYTAGFLSFVLPWIILIPLQTGTAIFNFQIWMSLIFGSSANFIIPFLMFFKCVEFRRQYNMKRDLSSFTIDRKPGITTKTVSSRKNGHHPTNESFSDVEIYADTRSTPRSIHSDSNSQNSRDLRVVLRSEFSEEGTPFVEPTDIGLPFSLIQSDIPDPIATGSEVTRSLVHDGKQGLGQINNTSFTGLLVRGRSQSATSSPKLTPIHMTNEAEDDTAEHIDMHIILPDIDSISNSDTSSDQKDHNPNHSLPSQLLQLPISERIRSGESIPRRSFDPISRSLSEVSESSLPREREYVVPPFYVLPAWFPISERLLAQTLLVSTTTICIANIAFSGYVQSTTKN